MPRFTRFAAATALAAVIATSTVPAAAVDLPRPNGPASAQAFDAGANSAEDRRWRRHRGDGIDGGDVLAGVLILGGIAAVASAVDADNDRDDSYRDYPTPPPRQERYEYRDGAAQGAPSSGLDRAADICADAVHGTSDPVRSVDSVRRGPSGWDVSGTLQNGGAFSCSIGNDGQIHDVQVGTAYNGTGVDDRPVWHGDDQSDDVQPSDGQFYDDQSYDDESYGDPS